MVKEFGTDSYGDIPTLPIAIFQSMKQYCGHFYTVERVTTTAAGSWCSFVEPYYCSLRGLVSAYGSDTTLPEILQIIAECVFENIETPKLVSPAADYPRVVSYQRQWISRQESTPGLPKTMFKSLTDSVTAS